jgi:hypothetical protein
MENSKVLVGREATILVITLLGDEEEQEMNNKMFGNVIPVKTRGGAINQCQCTKPRLRSHELSLSEKAGTICENVTY